MRIPVLVGVAVSVVAACGGPLSGPAATAAATAEELAAELAVARAGCVRCHAPPEASAGRVAPVGGPALAATVGWNTVDAGEAFLRHHHGGDAAADLAAWVRSLGDGSAPLRSVAVSPVAIERGERLFGELACRACHDPASLESLALRTDHAHVAAFLVDPAPHRPGVAHDFALDAGQAGALAAWLLRAQQSKTASVAVPGFAYECFEMKIASAAMPALDGVQPKSQGVADRIDVAVRTRDNHFALRWKTEISVPVAGEWTFTCGSDDCSWLWIDDVLLVENASIAPHRKKSGTVRLDAGRHALQVLYTEGEGGQSLEVLWRGPGVDEQEIPAARATATSVGLVPPVAGPLADAAVVQRGREQAALRRCGACHAIDDAAMAALPAPAPARPWAQLGEGNCPQQPGATGIRQAASLRPSIDPAAELAAALLRDGCLSCHTRDGRGGLPPIARQGLAEVEDLGDEGRLPPDLTGVGHRLRGPWIEKVLAEGHKARPYVKVRMPKVDGQRAHRYAELFAAVDGKPGDDDEPPFSEEHARLGQKLAGTTGRNCITCHPFAGHRALGAQGMDLSFQHQRLRPAWFREFVLQPTRFRPGTRMLPLWVNGDAHDRAEVDAVRSWLSLGAAAPVPAGLAIPGGLVIEPADRPRLHGAFLKGLSARCLAVGTAERTHYAYDLEHARLAWLWRGAFLDAEGTWSGRAGKLLEPLGEDWLVLDDLGFGARGEQRTVVGQRRTPAGHPVFCVAVGAAAFEDAVLPRLAQGGSELVRTLHCTSGPLAIDCFAQKQGKVKLFVAGAPAADLYTLQTGESLEVVYRW